MERCRAGIELVKQRVNRATLPLRTQYKRQKKDLKAATACPRGCLRKAQSKISGATDKITAGPKKRCERVLDGVRERCIRGRHRLAESRPSKGFRNLQKRVYDVTTRPRDMYKVTTERLIEEVEEAPGRWQRSYNTIQRRFQKGLDCTKRSYRKPKIQNNDHLKCLFHVRLYSVRAIRSMDQALTELIILHNHVLSLTLLSHRYE